MPRQRKPAAEAATAKTATPSTSASASANKWPARKSSDRGATLTHERLDEQLEAFRKAGGKIEVLGTTRSLRNIDVPQDQPAANAPAATPAPRRGR
ncbi:hypothetical protein [Pseudomarimonas arenosa]|uniref:Uncharacterized protein n=1 Tax=Pseudomarimonas arenosa TaxID=2774145 RepID=A0AAW3ZIW7_9GAMM|nr:hypothetical protein [Pseudomarimonas arenosa]MBD8524632.1 hypothetical protein [Pseudomarimonas arenosa]